MRTKRASFVFYMILICITLASLAFGVYSAITINFTASGTIVFENVNADCELDITITGLSSKLADDEGYTLTQNSDNTYSRTLKYSTMQTPTSGYTKITNNKVDLGKLKFDEYNRDITSSQRKTITISIVMHNYSDFILELGATANTSSQVDISTSDSIISFASTDGTKQTSRGSFVITLRAQSAISTTNFNIATVSIAPPSTYTVLQDGVDCTISDGVLTNYTGTYSKVIVPESVTEIGEKVFALYTTENKEDGTTSYTYSSNNTLTNVALPNSLTTVNASAFRSCNVLTSITIPSSVTSISDGAFSCAHLAEVYNLSSLDITAGSEDNGYVGYYAKVIHTSLSEPTRIQETNGVKYYVDASTNTLSALVGLDKSATAVTLRDDCTEINRSAFSGYTNLTGITFPNTLTTIRSSAFSACTSLATVTFGDNGQLVSIGTGAFYNCISLISITIPNSVTTINDWAFYMCSNLTTVVLSSNIEQIGKEVFLYCLNLQYTTYNNAKYLLDSYGNKVYLDRVIDKTITTYTISSGTRVLSYFAFNGCSNLVEVTIPASVVSIYGTDVSVNNTNSGMIIIPGPEPVIIGTFANCPKLTTVTFESNSQLKYLGAGAFYDCNNLKSITLPEGITEICENTFCQCYSLLQVSIPSTVTKISKNAFCKCYSLTSITLPVNLKTIYALPFSSNDAFSYCYALAEVYNLSSIDFSNTSISYTYIGSLTSYAKVIHTSLSEPSRISEIAGVKYYVYDSDVIALTPTNRSSVTSISLRTDCTEINKYAFQECTNLTTITLPSTLATIGTYAFYNCTSLTSITIPTNTSSIGDYAFSGCSALNTITMNSSSVGTLSIGLDMYFQPSGGSIQSTTVSKWQEGKGVYHKTK